MLRGYKDLKVCQGGYKLAIDIFTLTRAFHPDERYSLTSEIRRSSRGVSANIAEGYRKCQYPDMFVSKLADSDAKATQTQVWVDFAPDCGCLSVEGHEQLIKGYEGIGRMLSRMIANPEKFLPA